MNTNFITRKHPPLYETANRPAPVPVRILTAAILAAIIVFIWGNSASPADDSGVLSGRMTDFLNSAAAFFSVSYSFTDHIVRKLAHFTEYAALGFWLVITLRVHTPKIKRYFYAPAAAGLVIPVIDECIQLFFPGRSAQISDVILDYCGEGLGMLLAAVIFFRLFRKIPARGRR